MPLNLSNRDQNSGHLFYNRRLRAAITLFSVGVLFFGVILFPNFGREVEGLNAQAHRLNKRRTATKHRPREPFVLVAPFRQALGGRNDRTVRASTRDRVC